MKIDINISFEGDLKKDAEKIKKRIEDDLKQAVKALGVSAFKKAEELAESKLSGKLKDIYKSSLNIQQPSDNIFIIELKEDALWIERGRKAGFMEELLNSKSGSSVKTSKDGHKYRVIPMKNASDGKKTQSVGEDLVGDLKNFLKNQGVRTSKSKNLEMDENGSARIGRLHTFDIKKIRDKKGLSGDIKSVSVFQNKNPQTGKTERSIVAFRVISEKHRSSGKWNHPGTPPAKILEETFKWIEQQWQNQIFPAIKAKYQDP